MLAILATIAAVFLLLKYRRIRHLGMQSEERYRRLLQKAFDGTLMVDEESRRILEATGALLSLLGCREPEEIIGLPLSDLLFEEELDISALEGSKRELRLRRKDGAALETEVGAVRLPFGERSAVCLAVRDMTERKSLEQSLRHEATHDFLTDLPNRRFFADGIQQKISYHRRKAKTLAVIMLDLDNFKQVNDTLGHRAGDALLREFAQRLRKTLREYDLVARFGGDEFVVGLVDVESVGNVATVARKLMNLFEIPFGVEGQRVDYVSGSMGIALCPQDAEDAESLLACADDALYESKRKGKGCFSFYRDDSAETKAEVRV